MLPLEKKIKQEKRTEPRKVILLSGPTACGKTELSLILAKILGGEIVSADSVQVYQGMDIGTSKVSQEDQLLVAHHLIDIRDIQEGFNVVDFYFEAKQSLDSILARDRVPIVVGGSGFYLRTLLYGPPSGPPSVREIREQLEEEYERIGAEAMYAKLQDLDPDYAHSITANDRQKVVRALEIITLTGGKVSENLWKREVPIPDYDFHAWFIYKPKELLYPEIEARCESMLEAGFVDEVRALEKRGLRNNSRASQAIGYRQCLNFLETSQNEEEYQKFTAAFKKATRALAKRQFTWFRKEPLFHWLDVAAHDLETAAEMIAHEYYSVL